MTGDTVGGVWTFNIELAAGLSARGVEIMLATLGGEPSEAQRAEARRIPGLTLRASSHKLEWMEDPWEDVAASGQWLLGIEREFRPDCVHLNTLGHGALSWQAPVILTAHSCVLSWWEAVRREPLPDKWTRYRDHVRRSVHAAAVLTAPSQTMLRAIERHYGPDLPDRMVVLNGRKAAAFQAGRKQPFILTAGRLWDEAKNVAAVAEIAAGLPWPVYLAGDGASPDGGRVQFEGCRPLGRLSAEEIRDWYARASIYVLPARYEPFGLSVLEAALSGCALVLGDIPSLREIWGDAAVYVDPEDTGALASALGGVVGAPEWRIEMARRGRDRARAFTPERMAAGYLDAYRAVMERRVACVM